MTLEGEHSSPVVLVEPAADQRLGLTQRLEESGFRVEATASPSQALAAMRLRAPAAVLLAWEMPETGAEDLCRTIRRFPGWELVPVWVLAPTPSSDLVAASLAAGADGVLDTRDGAPGLTAYLTRAMVRAREEERLRAAECLRVLRRCARTLAQQINVPANFISMCAELLVEPYPEGSEVRLLGTKIEYQLSRIRGLVPRLEAVKTLDSNDPATDPDVVPLTGESSVQSAKRAAPCKTLVVDDEPEVRALIRQVLEQSGRFEVMEAANGRVCLERARKERPDLVLLDIMMPVMDGAEACRAIRADPLLNRTPVIVLTGMSAADEMVRLFELGASGYLVKPFTPRALSEQILRILERQLF
ncbi:MAG: response regulator [Candidatus Wallbacteria bacterium]|nr:response regulator [Candidatus Wallbacteria bacterium]